MLPVNDSLEAKVFQAEISPEYRSIPTSQFGVLLEAPVLLVGTWLIERVIRHYEVISHGKNGDCPCSGDHNKYKVDIVEKRKETFLVVGSSSS